MIPEECIYRLQEGLPFSNQPESQNSKLWQVLYQNHQLDNLHKVYEGQSAVDDISLASTDALRDREYLQACGYTESGRRSSRAAAWIEKQWRN